MDVAFWARNGLSRHQLQQLEISCSARWPESLDLRVLNLAPLSFRYEVTAHGQRMWASELDKVAAWESLTWQQYWDLHPYLERDWQQHVQYVMDQKDETERQQYQTALAKVRDVHRRVRKASSSTAS